MKLIFTLLFVFFVLFTNLSEGNCMDKSQSTQQVEQDTFAKIQKNILTRLEKDAKKLEEIKEMNVDITKKWQHFLGVILPIQIDVIKDFGYPGTQEGLLKFNQEYIKASESSEELTQLNQKKWSFVFEKAFGNVKEKEISLQLLESISEKLCQELRSDEFIQIAKHSLAALNKESTLVEKRQTLIEVLFQKKLEVLAFFELVGEDGYIQYSKAMIEHFHDSKWKAEMSDTYDFIMKETGLATDS